MSRPGPEAGLVNYAHRVAQQRAKLLLRELNERNRERERSRRVRQQRCLAFGEAVHRAGLGDWAPAEVLGFLLHAGESIRGSPKTMRLGFQKRGEAEWAKPEPDAEAVSSGGLQQD